MLRSKRTLFRIVSLSFSLSLSLSLFLSTRVDGSRVNPSIVNILCNFGLVRGRAHYQARSRSIPVSLLLQAYGIRNQVLELRPVRRQGESPKVEECHLQKIRRFIEKFSSQCGRRENMESKHNYFFGGYSSPL